MTTPLPLTDEQIKVILTSRHLTHVEIGKQLGIHRERIRAVRFGETHTDRLPHLERWTAYSLRPTCTRCINWRPLPAESPSCSFGFPDPIVESTYFARECNLYQPV